ncbi:organic hydroperoxide resistance protein [Vibrio zhugei]|uniref:Organic hydroperoxide resistance protein n=1 Tax=Vibrio zhugei TaxID=2479546 RepID=A0ABV7C7Z1_9VIBR|nr:organic hydroperoxide resistance protein [Vibrio zhugei]
MSIENVLYRAEATAKGGREGSAKTTDGKLDLTLSTPKELGGAGGSGTNPEQLFAMGYSACFLGALQFVAKQDGVSLSKDTTVTGDVGIGAIPTGFGIEVELKIHVPNLSKEEAEELAEKAHVVCPYSNATQNNIDVMLTIV